MRRHIIAASLLVFGIGLLAGCGQKGPLVLPTKPAPAPTSAVPASSASVAKPAGATTTVAPASATSGG
ncbi:MAG TPA: lipoprotein [Rhodanobacteraceae bacterium]|nr:lipoprotein [Rhodanobacteraceae bacterium]